MSSSRSRTRALARPAAAYVAIAAALLLSLALLTAVSGPADARPDAQRAERKISWTAAGKATIRPGVQAYTNGAQCTTNFVFTDARRNVYLGYAAHCAGKGAATDTNGCGQRSVALGTPVTFNRGGSLVSNGRVVGRGTLAYSSWITMNRLRTKAPNTCAYNDFALVKVGAKHVRKVNPTVPFFGGPTGIDTNGTRPGDAVYSYGNSSLRGGATVLSPKVGASLGDTGRGWSHQLYTVTPGVPGDSGSGFMTAGGKAVGTLSTLGLAPLPLSNNLGDLGRELAFAQRHSGIKGLQLTRGTRGFSPSLGDLG